MGWSQQGLGLTSLPVWESSEGMSSPGWLSVLGVQYTRFLGSETEHTKKVSFLSSALLAQFVVGLDLKPFEHIRFQLLRTGYTHRSWICPFSSPGTVAEIPGLLWIADVRSFCSTQFCPETALLQLCGLGRNVYFQVAMWWTSITAGPTVTLWLQNNSSVGAGLPRRRMGLAEFHSQALACSFVQSRHGRDRRTHVLLVSEAHGKDNWWMLLTYSLLLKFNFCVSELCGLGKQRALQGALLGPTLSITCSRKAGSSLW